MSTRAPAAEGRALFRVEGDQRGACEVGGEHGRAREGDGGQVLVHPERFGAADLAAVTKSFDKNAASALGG